MGSSAGDRQGVRKPAPGTGDRGPAGWRVKDPALPVVPRPRRDYTSDGTWAPDVHFESRLIQAQCRTSRGRTMAQNIQPDRPIWPSVPDPVLRSGRGAFESDTHRDREGA